jgi:hypothetical protein
LPDAAAVAVALVVDDEPELPETMPAEELPADIGSGGAQ